MIARRDLELDAENANRCRPQPPQVFFALAIDDAGDDEPERRAGPALLLENLEGTDRDLDVLRPHDATGEQEERLEDIARHPAANPGADPQHLDRARRHEPALNRATPAFLADTE